MKNFFVLLWRYAIPLLWLLSVQAIIRGGFQPGFGQLPPPGQSYPYPWAGVILTITVATFESAILYFVLRPDKFVLALPRFGAAFGIFFVLSIGAYYILLTTDLPRYVYVLSEFTMLVTLLIFLLLIIFVPISLVKHLWKKAQVS